MFINVYFYSQWVVLQYAVQHRCGRPVPALLEPNRILIRYVFCKSLQNMIHIFPTIYEYYLYCKMYVVSQTGVPVPGAKQNRITSIPKPVGIDPIQILTERENR